MTHQIEPIDDYIEPLLKIKAKSKEIENLTLKKDFQSAFDANTELQAECMKLEHWLWKHMDDVK